MIHKHDKAKFIQAKTDKAALKALPAGTSVAALRARVEQLEKILGLT